MPDLAALRRLLDLSTITSLTVGGHVVRTFVKSLTGLFKDLSNLRTLQLISNGMKRVGATTVTAARQDPSQKCQERYSVL